MLDLVTLLEGCRNGDELAWEALVHRYQARVHAMAYHYVRDADEARDLAQETFVRIYQRLDSAKSEGFVAWMLRISRNLCIDQLRRRKARTSTSTPSRIEEASVPVPSYSFLTFEKISMCSLPRAA